MKRQLIAAAVLLLSAAQSAWAQTDPFDAGDWFWLDTSGNAPGANAIFANGAGVRQGDKVQLDMFIVFRNADDNGVIAARVQDTVDCTAHTGQSRVRALIFADGSVVDAPAPTEGPTTRPLDADTSLHKFACEGDRSRGTYFGQGSRRQFAATLFAQSPAP